MQLMSSLLLLASCLLPAGAQTVQLTLDNLLDAPARAPVQVLSPDGRFFAVVDHNQVALLPAAGGPAQTLTSTPAAKSELNWSPDGRSLAFTSEGDVWTVAMDGGRMKRLTHDPVGSGDPRGAADHRPMWDPHGRWILYQSGRKGFNELYVVSDDGAHEALLAATEIYTGADVIASRAPDRGDAVSSDRFDPEPAWSPDGMRIVYTERSRQFFSGKLKSLAFDARTGRPVGAPQDLYTAANDKGGAWAVNTDAWSPDSRTLAVVLQTSGWDKIWLIPAAGGKPEPLTHGTGEDEQPVYSPDGKWLAFLSNRDAPEERHLWIASAAGGTPRRATNLPGVESAPQWSPDSKRIYFLQGTALREPALYSAAVLGPADARPVQPLPDSKYEHLGITPEAVHFQGKDGLPLSGILFRPPHYRAGKPYPAVIWAHGGPEAQVLLNLDVWALFLAQQGYVVFEPNFRGSTGYGEAFRNSNVEDSGGGEIDDMAASVHYLVAQGLVDPKRVAIGGGSHGGTVVANAVTKLPGTFAAGIEMFGVVDRALFLQHTNRNSKIRWETKMGGTPEQKPAVYRKANVLPDVARVTTPLLILHGEQDPQVPPQESAALVAALQRAGKVYSYKTYPNEGHGFQQRDHRKDAYERELAFLKQYLGR